MLPKFFRKCLIVFSVFLFIAYSCSKPETPADKPNILFIFIDDYGWSSPSCYGDTLVDTKNIDQLAAQGMKFTDAYVTPQCTPTRASLLTGQNTIRNKMWHVIPGYRFPFARVDEPEYIQGLPRDTVTLAEALKASGYTTAILGKWHLHNYGSDGYYTRLWDSCKQYYGFDYVNPVTNPTEYQSYGDKGVDFLTDEAIKFMGKSKSEDKPFFIYLSHHTIHNPVLAPETLIEHYDDLGYPREGQNESVYLAALKHMDNSIGRLLNSLDSMNLTKNTVVFFYSDNGGVDSEFEQAPLRNGKGSPYEGGIRVPLIVRWPGEVKPGTVNQTPVYVPDIYPTLVDIAKGKMPENHVVDGISILPALHGDSLPSRSLYWYLPLYDIQWGATPCAVIRKGDYKLLWFFGDYVDVDQNFKYIPEGRVELYNLKEDISESHNITDQHPELTHELQEELKEWILANNEPIPGINPNYNPDSVYVRKPRPEK